MSIPPILQQAYPSLLNIVEITIILLEQRSDELLWSQADYGQLSLKSAYAHFNPPGNNIFWAKLVWNISMNIPFRKELSFV